MAPTGGRRLQIKENEVLITCSNWRSPIYPGIIPGFFIRTYDHHLDHVIDSSESLSLDGSALANENHVSSFSSTNQYTTKVTDLTFSFETALPVEQGCFVKLEIPREFDMSLFDPALHVISAGMLVGEDGMPNTQVYEYNSEGKYIVVEGCKFDPSSG